jgi:hypothetical protein
VMAARRTHGREYPHLARGAPAGGFHNRGCPGKTDRRQFGPPDADYVSDSRLSFEALWPPRRRGCGVVLTRRREATGGQ